MHEKNLASHCEITIKNDSHDAPASFVDPLPKRPDRWQSERSRVEGRVRSWAFDDRIGSRFRCFILVEKRRKRLARWCFHPYLGKISNLTYIFQRG